MPESKLFIFLSDSKLLTLSYPKYIYDINIIPLFLFILVIALVCTIVCNFKLIIIP
jgi:hypothetical protein